MGTQNFYLLNANACFRISEVKAIKDNERWAWLWQLVELQRLLSADDRRPQEVLCCFIEMERERRRDVFQTQPQRLQSDPWRRQMIVKIM